MSCRIRLQREKSSQIVGNLGMNPSSPLHPPGTPGVIQHGGPTLAQNKNPPRVYMLSGLAGGPLAVRLNSGLATSGSGLVTLIDVPCPSRW